MCGSSGRRITGRLLRAACTTAVVIPLLTGCAGRTTGAAALPDRQWSGHLLPMERANWFRPCDADPDDALLWVTFTDHSVLQIERARAEGMALAGDTAFVRWRAALTDERLVGPGGPALLVRDILEVRPATVGLCRTEPGSAP